MLLMSVILIILSELCNQMNHGFKCEVKDGKEDDIGGKQCREWLIHNLVLFIDNEDTPQIPRRYNYIVWFLVNLLIHFEMFN